MGATHLPFHRGKQVLPGEREETDDADDAVELGIESLKLVVVRVALFGGPIVIEIQLRRSYESRRKGEIETY
jgi:hypothetical protein